MMNKKSARLIKHQNVNDSQYGILERSERELLREVSTYYASDFCGLSLAPRSQVTKAIEKEHVLSLC